MKKKQIVHYRANFGSLSSLLLFVFIVLKMTGLTDWAWTPTLYWLLPLALTDAVVSHWIRSRFIAGE